MAASDKTEEEEMKKVEGEGKSGRNRTKGEPPPGRRGRERDFPESIQQYQMPQRNQVRRSLNFDHYDWQPGGHGFSEREKW